MNLPSRLLVGVLTIGLPLLLPLPACTNPPSGNDGGSADASSVDSATPADASTPDSGPQADGSFADAAGDGGYVCAAPDGSTQDGSVGACWSYPGVVPYCPGISEQGWNGNVTFVVVSMDPQPPALGTNNWTVEAIDSSGNSVSGVLCATPFMPQMGHGSSVAPTVAQTDGGFAVNNLYFVMQGVWQVSMALCAPGSTCSTNASGSTAQCQSPADGGATLDTTLFTLCAQ